jgi:hypothetical protein
MKYSYAMNKIYLTPTYKSQKPVTKGFAKHTLLLLVLMVFIGNTVFAQIAVDNTSTGSTVNGSSITISHTTGTGDNRLMMVGVSYQIRQAGVIVNQTGSYTNTALISGSDNELIPGNNTNSVTITLCQAGNVKPLFNN